MHSLLCATLPLGCQGKVLAGKGRSSERRRQQQQEQEQEFELCQPAGRLAAHTGKQLQTNGALTAASVGQATHVYEAYFTFKIHIILVTLYEI
jgi:hypothetical protein